MSASASDGGYSANQPGSGTWSDSASRSEASESDANDTTEAHNLSGCEVSSYGVGGWLEVGGEVVDDLTT